MNELIDFWFDRRGNAYVAVINYGATSISDPDIYSIIFNQKALRKAVKYRYLLDNSFLMYWYQNTLFPLKAPGLK